MSLIHNHLSQLGTTPYNGSFTSSFIDLGRQQGIESKTFEVFPKAQAYKFGEPKGFNAEDKVYEVIPETPVYILGEKIRRVFGFIYSKLPAFSFPSAEASSIESCSENCEIPIGVATPKIKFQRDYITPENLSNYSNLYSKKAFNLFMEFASSTGGVMGLSPSSEHVLNVIEDHFKHILNDAKPGAVIDIAFVVDTTVTMEDTVEQLKKGLVTTLERLKKNTKHTVRIAHIEFRDRWGCEFSFLTQINAPFDTKLDRLSRAFDVIDSNGGWSNEKDVAVFDALYEARTQLEWKGGKRAVILITDAPSHDLFRNYDEDIQKRYFNEDIIKQYQEKGREIAICPILMKASKE